MFGKEDFVARVMKNLLQGPYFGTNQNDTEHVKGFQMDFINQLGKLAGGHPVDYEVAANHIDDLFRNNHFRQSSAGQVRDHCIDYINQLSTRQA